MARSRSQSTRAKTSSAGTSGGSQRLQKLLAAAGFGSRRACEELITAGRVDVDGEVVTELGAKADPNRQKIRVDGEPLRRVRFRYFALHKPPGVVSTARDPSGRPRVVDLVPQDIRVFPVGRLDKSSEGLILLTNDGELANGLTHPRYAVRKVYHVLAAGQVTAEQLQVLKRGVHLAEGFAKVVSAKVRSTEGKATWLEIVLDEGRNREIRRILARVGHKVLRLIRVEMGGVRLGDMPQGAYRQLTPQEVEKLHEAVRESRKRKTARVAAEGTPARTSSARTGPKQAGSRQTGPKRTATAKTAKKVASTRPGRPPRKGARRDATWPAAGRKARRVGSLIGLEDEAVIEGLIEGGEPYTDREDHGGQGGRPLRPGRKKRRGRATGARGTAGPRKTGRKSPKPKAAKAKKVTRKPARRKQSGKRRR